MPSVGMRRTTRVFGARVLRSGRRVWTGSGDRKYMKTTSGEEWIDLLETSGGRGGGGHHARDCKENGWQQNDVSANQEVLDMDIEEKGVESGSKKLEHDGSVVDNSVGRVFTNVYTRKRKVGSNHFDVFVSGENTSTLKDKKCGKTYCRNSWSKKWSKKTRLCEMADACDPTVSSAMRKDLVKTLKIVVQSSCARRYIVACLLNSVLRYMGKSRIRQDQLFAFFHSKSLSQVYSSCGIHFLQDSNFSLERGVCMIMGGNCSTPVFALDFSAVPFCFIHLHLSILLRGIRLSYILVALVMYTEEEDDGMIISSIDSEMTHSANVTLTSQVYGSGTHVSYVNSGAANLTGQNVHVRNSRNIQKRSSFRSKRGRPPSSLTAQKLNGAMASNMFVARQNSLRPPSMAPGRELRSSAQRTNSMSSKQVKSALVALPRDADSTTCSANILVVESDRCYREQGATITLDVSAKKQWYLAIKAGGMRQYSVVAEKFMRPCSCNRFTHAIIWAADNGWKLEFSDRRDWLIFKELYKECSDRNVQVPVESCIPVPGVCEVPLCENSNNGAFMRPASYITVKEDELVRALTSRAANYDMDSDDEEWINKYNNELSAENNSQMILSDEIFELIIDAFERGFHCNPDDYSDEMVVPSIGLNLEKRILEAVYGYWIKKRKQKRSALVRVFQYYQPRRSQVIPKSVLRKKRSFKRQGSRAGRGKQRSFLHAMAAERDVGGKQNAILKVEEAKAAANRSTELAVVKRERAQLLMQNADLLTYKATMAVRIAELARIAKSTCGDDLSQVAAGSPEAIVGLCSDKQ